MGQKYQHMSASERNYLQSSLNKGHSQSAIALALQRSRSTISRELARNGRARSEYDAVDAREAVGARRRRGPRKLREGTALHSYAFSHIRLGWSPQQISGKLKQMQDSDAPGPKLPNLSHETIYRAIYVLPRGEIRKEIIGLLRQAKKSRGHPIPRRSIKLVRAA
jgi:IS30 family transposase